VFEPQQKFCDV